MNMKQRIILALFNHTVLSRKELLLECRRMMESKDSLFTPTVCPMFTTAVAELEQRGLISRTYDNYQLSPKTLYLIYGVKQCG